LFNTSSAGSITGMMPAPMALGPAPKFAPAVIGSLGRAVGAVNGVNVPGAVRGLCAGDGTVVGDWPIGTACCAFCCAKRIPYCWFDAVEIGSCSAIYAPSCANSASNGGAPCGPSIGASAPMPGIASPGIVSGAPCGIAAACLSRARWSVRLTAS